MNPQQEYPAPHLHKHPMNNHWEKTAKWKLYTKNGRRDHGGAVPRFCRYSLYAILSTAGGQIEKADGNQIDSKTLPGSNGNQYGRPEEKGLSNNTMHKQVGHRKTRS